MSLHACVPPVLQLDGMCSASCGPDMMPAATYSTLSKLINKLHSMTGFVAKFIASCCDRVSLPYPSQALPMISIMTCLIPCKCPFPAAAMSNMLPLMQHRAEHGLVVVLCCCGNRVQVINGQIVVNTASLTVQAQRTDDVATYTRVEEDVRFINSRTYAKRLPAT